MSRELALILFLVVSLFLVGVGLAALILLTRRRSPGTARQDTQVSAPASQRSSPVVVAKAAKTCNVSTGRGFPLGIVGESNYQGAIRHADHTDPERDRLITVVVQREPTNPYDANAIVVTTMDERTLGYFSREDAVYYQAALKAAEEKSIRVICRAKLTGARGQKRSYGVILDFPESEEIARALVETEEGAPF